MLVGGGPRHPRGHPFSNRSSSAGGVYVTVLSMSNDGVASSGGRLPAWDAKPASIARPRMRTADRLVLVSIDSAAKITQLTPEAQNIIRERQHLVALLLHYIPRASLWHGSFGSPTRPERHWHPVPLFVSHHAFHNCYYRSPAARPTTEYKPVSVPQSQPTGEGTP
jgi:hypothetical protein